MKKYETAEKIEENVNEKVSTEKKETAKKVTVKKEEEVTPPWEDPTVVTDGDDNLSYFQSLVDSE